MPAYNNYFPVGYQPYQPQTVVPQMQQQILQPSSGIIWVQGEAGAKAYPVGSGNSVLLMDSEKEQFYIKTTDASGMPLPLRVFTFKEITNTVDSNASTTNFDPTVYVTKEELESRLNELKTRSAKGKSE